MAEHAAPEAPARGLAALEALRARGAWRCDPARWRYLETLAARAAEADGMLGAELDRRLASAVLAYEAQAAQALREAELAAAACAAPLAEGAGALQRLLDAGDAPALRGLVARLQARGLAPGPLAVLLKEIDGTPATHESASTAPTELKALQRARGTWARLAVERQINRSLATMPDNPGPLNSHLLVLRAMKALQALSPAYLERFVVHAETLAWLDQAQAQAPVAALRVRERATHGSPPQRTSRPRQTK